MSDIKSVEEEILKELERPFEEISIINVVNLFVMYAYIARSSDIHIQPEADGVRIRFRVDGLLRDVFPHEKITQGIHQEIITRIKVMSGLRTDEHLSPQDGRLRVKIPDFGDVDVRVSIMPTYHGENAVLRVLAESRSFALKDLDFGEREMIFMVEAIRRPYGMILASGPTGSGKSTTLYTILKELNNPDTSIITIEDPIEYSLEGSTQTQVNVQSGLTFAAGLRSILRQDPNIVMVGEIRDSETASIAVNAALTGHLVLTTVHTNDAATTFPRLIDMGVPPFLVASTVNIAIGQRLLRKLCQTCKEERVLTEKEALAAAELIPEIRTEQNLTFFVAKGCDECGGSGYVGRVGIREVLPVTNDIRQLIMTRASAQDIKILAVKAGMNTMLTDGYKKALQGLTSLEELLRIIHE